MQTNNNKNNGGTSTAVAIAVVAATGAMDWRSKLKTRNASGCGATLAAVVAATPAVADSASSSSSGEMPSSWSKVKLKRSHSSDGAPAAAAAAATFGIVREKQPQAQAPQKGAAAAAAAAVVQEPPVPAAAVASVVAATSAVAVSVSSSSSSFGEMPPSWSKVKLKRSHSSDGAPAIGSTVLEKQPQAAATVPPQKGATAAVVVQPPVPAVAASWQSKKLLVQETTTTSTSNNNDVDKIGVSDKDESTSSSPQRAPDDDNNNNCRHRKGNDNRVIENEPSMDSGSQDSSSRSSSSEPTITALPDANSSTVVQQATTSTTTPENFMVGDQEVDTTNSAAAAAAATAEKSQSAALREKQGIPEAEEGPARAGCRDDMVAAAAAQAAASAAEECSLSFCPGAVQVEEEEEGQVVEETGVVQEEEQKQQETNVVSSTSTSRTSDDTRTGGHLDEDIGSGPPTALGTANELEDTSEITLPAPAATAAAVDAAGNGGDAEIDGKTTLDDDDDDDDNNIDVDNIDHGRDKDEQLREQHEDDSSTSVDYGYSQAEQQQQQQHDDDTSSEAHKEGAKSSAPPLDESFGGADVHTLAADTASTSHEEPSSPTENEPTEESSPKENSDDGDQDKDQDAVDKHNGPSAQSNDAHVADERLEEDVAAATASASDDDENDDEEEIVVEADSEQEDDEQTARDQSADADNRFVNPPFRGADDQEGNNDDLTEIEYDQSEADGEDVEGHSGDDVVVVEDGSEGGLTEIEYDQSGVDGEDAEGRNDEEVVVVDDDVDADASEVYEYCHEEGGSVTVKEGENHETLLDDMIDKDESYKCGDCDHELKTDPSASNGCTDQPVQQPNASLEDAHNPSSVSIFTTSQLYEVKEEQANDIPAESAAKASDVPAELLDYSAEESPRDDDDQSVNRSEPTGPEADSEQARVMNADSKRGENVPIQQVSADPESSGDNFIQLRNDQTAVAQSRQSDDSDSSENNCGRRSCIERQQQVGHKADIQAQGSDDSEQQQQLMVQNEAARALGSNDSEASEANSGDVFVYQQADQSAATETVNPKIVSPAQPSDDDPAESQCDDRRLSTNAISKLAEMHLDWQLGESEDYVQQLAEMKRDGNAQPGRSAGGRSTASTTARPTAWPSAITNAETTSANEQECQNALLCAESRRDSGTFSPLPTTEALKIPIFQSPIPFDERLSPAPKKSGRVPLSGRKLVHDEHTPFDESPFDESMIIQTDNSAADPSEIPDAELSSPETMISDDANDTVDALVEAPCNMPDETIVDSIPSDIPFDEIGIGQPIVEPLKPAMEPASLSETETMIRTAVEDQSEIVDENKSSVLIRSHANRKRCVMMTRRRQRAGEPVGDSAHIDPPAEDCIAQESQSTENVLNESSETGLPEPPLPGNESEAVSIELEPQASDEKLNYERDEENEANANEIKSQKSKMEDTIEVDGAAVECHRAEHEIESPAATNEHLETYSERSIDDEQGLVNDIETQGAGNDDMPVQEDPNDITSQGSDRPNASEQSKAHDEVPISSDGDNVETVDALVGDSTETNDPGTSHETEKESLGSDEQSQAGAQNACDKYEMTVKRDDNCNASVDSGNNDQAYDVESDQRSPEKSMVELKIDNDRITRDDERLTEEPINGPQTVSFSDQKSDNGENPADGEVTTTDNETVIDCQWVEDLVDDENSVRCGCMEAAGSIDTTNDVEITTKSGATEPICEVNPVVEPVPAVNAIERETIDIAAGGNQQQAEPSENEINATTMDDTVASPMNEMEISKETFELHFEDATLYTCAGEELTDGRTKQEQAKDVAEGEDRAKVLLDNVSDTEMRRDDENADPKAAAEEENKTTIENQPLSVRETVSGVETVLAMKNDSHVDDVNSQVAHDEQEQEAHRVKDAVKLAIVTATVDSLELTPSTPLIYVKGGDLVEVPIPDEKIEEKDTTTSSVPAPDQRIEKKDSTCGPAPGSRRTIPPATGGSSPPWSSKIKLRATNTEGSDFPMRNRTGASPAPPPPPPEPSEPAAETTKTVLKGRFVPQRPAVASNVSSSKTTASSAGVVKRWTPPQQKTTTANSAVSVGGNRGGGVVPPPQPVSKTTNSSSLVVGGSRAGGSSGSIVPPSLKPKETTRMNCTTIQNAPQPPPWATHKLKKTGVSTIGSAAPAK
jgi:hypothetical protein